MPYQILKNTDGSYKVINRDTGRVHAKHTTLENARKQVRLMYMIDHKKLNNVIYGKKI